MRRPGGVVVLAAAIVAAALAAPPAPSACADDEPPAGDAPPAEAPPAEAPPAEAPPAEPPKAPSAPPQEPPKPEKDPKDPRNWSEEEKKAKLAELEKLYEENRRVQDEKPTRARRNAARLAGDLRYPPAAKFLLKVFDDDRDLTTQVTALVALGKTDDLDAIQHAVGRSLAIASKKQVFALNLPRLFAGVEDKAPREWIVTKLVQRDDEMTATIAAAVGEAAVEVAVPELVELIEKNKDVRVRFEALRALGRCGGKAVIPRLLAWTSDEDWRLRMAAIEGLGFTREPEVIAHVAKAIVRTEEPIVVETAIEAVARLGTKDAFEPLVEGLRCGRLRARQKARAALRGLAKSLYGHEKDYHVDPNAWSSYWKKVKSGLNPDDPSFTKSETTSYFSFPVESDRALFILDVSGSMKWPDPPKDAGIRPSDWRERRIDLAHREMFKVLRSLAAQNRGRVAKKAKKGETSDLPSIPSEEGVEPPTLFNVATFSSGVTPWQKEVVLANDENVESAISWIERMLPAGGTATYDALEFGLAQPGIDSIYFLSDGVPSLGKYDERETILAELRKLNRFRRISIHTIALIVGLSPIEKARKYEDPEDMAEFMGRVASEHQGRFANESKP